MKMISLVIPAYNERENIPSLVAACREAVEPYQGVHELVLVNDGSTDGSAELIDSMAARDAFVRPIHHLPGHNIGCHPSELEGLLAARGDVMVFLPADLQIHPSVLPAFLVAARNADIVASHRRHRADAAWRRWLSGANNVIERALLGVGVHDAHSSMAFTRRAADEVLTRVVSRSALIPAEILVRARTSGLTIAEIEIPHHPRRFGTQTGAKIGEIGKVQMDMLKLRHRLAREKD